MYSVLKSTVKVILPHRLLKKYENPIRQILALFYRGSRYQCNICETKIRQFINGKSNDLICPRCGSLPRTRGLWNIIKDRIKEQTILHFSPPQALQDIIRSTAQAKRYITTDYSGEFDSESQLDIENIDLEDEEIDLIICYHVLEHVDDDIKALKELYRILKASGQCYIQTPFKEGSIYENPSITEPAERLKHFGQKDHVRIYSPQGLVQRLRDVGFATEIMVINNDPTNHNGLKTKDIILIATKDGGSQDQQ